MKGLMVTLLIVLGSGTALAQQFGGNDFSANRSVKLDNSGNSVLDSRSRTNQTRMQPLKRPFSSTAMRVAQSSSVNADSRVDLGRASNAFSATSRQTIGGSNYRQELDAKRAVDFSGPGQTSDLDLGHDHQGHGVNTPKGQSDELPQSRVSDDRRSTTQRASSRPFSSHRPSQTGFSGSNNSSQTTQSMSGLNNRMTPMTLEVTHDLEQELKQVGYLYATIKPQLQGKIDEIVMFQNRSNYSNRSGTGSNVTSDHWDLHHNTAVIDITDFDLRAIQNRTLTLRELGGEKITGVALRYVGDDGHKIALRDIRQINGSEFPSRGAASASHNRLPVSFAQRRTSDRIDPPSDPQDNFERQRVSNNDGGWNLNNGRQQRRPNLDIDDRRFADDNRSPQYISESLSGSRPRESNRYRESVRDDHSRLSNEYLAGLDQRDGHSRHDRDLNYMRDSIDRDRRDLTENRYESDYDRPRSRYTSASTGGSPPGRSTDFDATLAAERHELRKRWQQADELHAKLEEEAAWAKHQRAMMEENRIAQQQQESLGPLKRSYMSVPTSLGGFPSYHPDRLADRSVDPVYTGPRVDAFAGTNHSSAAADRVFQHLADHMAKMEVINRKLDAKATAIERDEQRLNDRLSNGRVSSLVPRATVPNTLGGDMATPRHDRLASNATPARYDGLPSTAPVLDINGHRRGSSSAARYSSSNGSASSTGSASDGKMLRLMWLLLLISLAVNGYLAILSRSFYTQYEELADELRETFSSSSSL